MSEEMAKTKLMDLFGSLHKREITPEEAMVKFEELIKMVDTEDTEQLEETELV